MLGFHPRLPVSEDQRKWLEEGFERLSRVLGRNRMLQARVILPTVEFFPDKYDATEAAVVTLFRRLCRYMHVDFNRIELHVEPDRIGPLKSSMPSWSGDSNYPAGLYTKAIDDSQTVICLAESLLKDPLAAAATLAHELGHLILLGGELLDPNTKDMEPLTDLLTVF